MSKWYSIYDKIYRNDNLEEAFKQVKRNYRAPGIDGVTIEDYEARLSENLELVHKELKTKTYKPSAVRRVQIPKPDGGKRPLGTHGEIQSGAAGSDQHPYPGLRRWASPIELRITDTWKGNRRHRPSRKQLCS